MEEHKSCNEVEVNPKLAEKIGITDGEMVRLKTRRGSIELKAKITHILADDVVFTTFHYIEAAANLLTSATPLDPVAKIPPLKVCSASLEKL